MLRLPVPRAIGSSPSSLLRASARSQQLLRPFQSTRQAHAVANPTLANIEKRWETMAPQDQAELWMALRDRMTVDWHELTMQEKKACKLCSLCSYAFQKSIYVFSQAGLNFHCLVKSLALHHKS